MSKKGHKQTEKTKQKIRKANKGKHNSLTTEFKKGHLLLFTKDTGEKISKGLKRAYKEKRRFGFLKGHKTWNKGIKNCFNKKTLKKMSNAQKGDKSCSWRGGKSFEPYSVDWTDDLKKAIRKRDRYTCRICGKEPSIIVHHIDYNKKNCNPNNLITLCKKCHSKTNHNREYWIKYFNN